MYRRGSKSPRLLFICNTLAPGVEGEAQYARRWVLELSKRFATTVLVGDAPSPEHCDSLPDCDICYLTVPKVLRRMKQISFRLKPDYQWFYWKAKHWFQNLGSEADFDIIHHLNPFSYRYASPAIHAKKGKLFIGPIQGGVPMELPSGLKVPSTELQPAKWFDPWLLRRGGPISRTHDRASRILIAADYAKRYVATYHLPKVVLFNNAAFGVDYLRPRSGTGPLRVMMFGSSENSLGLSIILDAMSQVTAYAEVILTIVVSDRSTQNRAASSIQRLGLNGFVTLVNRKGDFEKSSIFRDFDVIGQCDFKPRSAGLLVDAMINGVVPVVLDCGGAAGIVKCDCGFPIALDSREVLTDRFARAFRTLASNREHLKEMSTKCQRSAEERFGSQSRFDSIAELYQSVLRMPDEFA